ncbi:hypothetical protein [Streptomyces subrutilus]|uniref:hypothetical protein n=1 Tax=Streptomyces subrutilus TaxID=36818 RepID=UPI00143061E1|nr:hypothetical protein [Streptomyces subrutilus]
MDLPAGARLAITVYADAPAWALGKRPAEPRWEAAGTAALLLLRTAALARLSLRRPRE